MVKERLHGKWNRGWWDVRNPVWQQKLWWTFFVLPPFSRLLTLLKTYPTIPPHVFVLTRDMTFHQSYLCLRLACLWFLFSFKPSSMPLVCVWDRWCLKDLAARPPLNEGVKVRSLTFFLVRNVYSHQSPECILAFLYVQFDNTHTHTHLLSLCCDSQSPLLFCVGKKQDIGVL